MSPGPNGVDLTLGDADGARYQAFYDVLTYDGNNYGAYFHQHLKGPHLDKLWDDRYNYMRNVMLQLDRELIEVVGDGDKHQEMCTRMWEILYENSARRHLVSQIGVWAMFLGKARTSSLIKSKTGKAFWSEEEFTSLYTMDQLTNLLHAFLDEIDTLKSRPEDVFIRPSFDHGSRKRPYLERTNSVEDLHPTKRAKKKKKKPKKCRHWFPLLPHSPQFPLHFS